MILSVHIRSESLDCKNEAASENLADTLYKLLWNET